MDEMFTIMVYLVIGSIFALSVINFGNRIKKSVSSKQSQHHPEISSIFDKRASFGRIIIPRDRSLRDRDIMNLRRVIMKKSRKELEEQRRMREARIYSNPIKRLN